MSPNRIAGCLAGLLVLLAGPAASAGERVVVVLKNGQTLDAEVSARSSDAALWLRFAAGSTEVLRRVPWGDVARVSIAGEDLDVPTLPSRIRSLIGKPEPAVHPALQSATIQTAADATAIPLAERARLALAPPTVRLQSIWADAHLAHWDADAAADGLVIRLLPIDGIGRVVPADGLVEVELWDDSPSRRRLARWTCQLTAPQFGPSGYITRLPFSSAQPRLDAEASPRASLLVRFTSPGEGTFSYTLHHIRIRPLTRGW